MYMYIAILLKIAFKSHITVLVPSHRSVTRAKYVLAEKQKKKGGGINRLFSYIKTDHMRNAYAHCKTPTNAPRFRICSLGSHIYTMACTSTFLWHINSVRRSLCTMLNRNKISKT